MHVYFCSTCFSNQLTIQIPMPSVAILHPDLGIGGAERLIVDCALALQQCGYSIMMFTNHHDRNHCFVETKNGQIPIMVVGDWIPRSTFGWMKAFWAYIRMIYLTLYFVLNCRFDVVICDQVSSGIPLLRIFKHKCIFYCHFPDQLLAKHDGLLKKLYRYPIDWFEEWTIGYSNVILVNSKFTNEIFHQTFKSLNHVPTKVLYPSVNFNNLDGKLINKVDLKLPNVQTIFLSINRYERKKNLDLAIQAMAVLRDNSVYALQDQDRSSIHLIIAGGYDHNNAENIEYFQELNSLAQRLNLFESITFLKDVSDEHKHFLLHRCTAVIYTPQNEHFGIVPLEAMFMKRPVIAANSGGPTETIIHNETGFLCEPNAHSFADAMFRFISQKSLSTEMGQKGHQHVIDKFNFDKFKNNLNIIVTRLMVET